MWILRQLFLPEWQEFEAAMEKADYSYACSEIAWNMEQGCPVQVAHNLRSHALLFRLVTHPKDTPPSYHYFGRDGLDEFSNVDDLSSMIHPMGRSLDERLALIGGEICEAIHTLGPLLDGQPKQGLHIAARDWSARFRPWTWEKSAIS
jgi:hypothetical protein